MMTIRQGNGTICPNLLITVIMFIFPSHLPLFVVNNNVRERFTILTLVLVEYINLKLIESNLYARHLKTSLFFVFLGAYVPLFFKLRMLMFPLEAVSNL